MRPQSHCVFFLGVYLLCYGHHLYDPDLCRNDSIHFHCPTACHLRGLCVRPTVASTCPSKGRLHPPPGSLRGRVTVVLVTALLHLYVLGVGGVGYISLAHICAPNPTVFFFLASISSAMATIYMILTSAVMTQSISIAPLPAIYVASASAPLLRPLVQVGTPTSAADLVLLGVCVYFVPCHAVIQEADVVCPYLDMRGGGGWSQSVAGTLFIWIEHDSNLLVIRSFQAHVALLACQFKEFM